MLESSSGECVGSWLNLHRLLNQGLSCFLNAEHQTRAGKLLYPAVDRQQSGPWEEWREDLLDAVQNLGDHRILSRISNWSPDVAGTAECLAQVFGWAIRHYPVACAAGHPFKLIHCLRRFDLETYQAQGKFVAPVIQLWEYANRHLPGLITGLYIHGSLSTLDYVPSSSDLDTVLIVPQATLLSPRKLVELRKHVLHTLRWFHQIDYSQHHGHTVLSDLDLCFFDDTWFPRVLFTISTALVGSDRVRIRSRGVPSDVSLPFRRMCSRIHQVAQGRIAIRGWYALKLHLQGILLLPTLFLQACGSPTYKRDSFEPVRSRVPEEAWRLIENISAIRALGLQEPLVSPWMDRQIARLPTPWAASILHRWCKNRVPDRAWAILGDGWLEQSLLLADSLMACLNGDRGAL
jgi:hypothetical protein